MSRNPVRPGVHAACALACCLLLFAATLSSAQIIPTVSFDPTPITVLHAPCSEDTFTVAVVIDDTPAPVQGFEFVFEFDPTVVEPVEVLEGGLLTGSGFPTFFVWLNQSAVGDSVKVNAAVLGGTFTGPGELVQIRFLKLWPATTPLDWRMLDFRDDQNLMIPVGSESGLVHIEPCPVAVEETTWGAVKRHER
jgi:hypothetical protein